MRVTRSETVRLALIGAGNIATVHGLCALQVPEAQITRVWSRSSDKAESLASRLGASPCDDLAEAFSSSDVDAVLVCTPNWLHAEHTLMALRAGKHVICEKPMARTLESAQAMITVARGSGLQLHIAHVVRFYPEFVKLHELVQSGAIGRPALARMARCSAFPHGSDDWHNDQARSGGVLLDMGIHDLDWLLWTFGPAQRVTARGLYGQRPPFLDYALATVRFASGAMAHIESSWAEREGFHTQGEISGDAGLLAYDSCETTALKVTLRTEPADRPGVSIPSSHTAESPYVRQLAHYCRRILGRDGPLIEPESALMSLELALAALDSIRSGQPVALDGGAQCA